MCNFFLAIFPVLWGIKTLFNYCCPTLEKGQLWLHAIIIIYIISVERSLLLGIPSKTPHQQSLCSPYPTFLMNEINVFT